MSTRPPAVAGKFYSHSAAALKSQMVEWLRTPHHTASNHTLPIRALIVPHAGYMFSGNVAADAYRYLIPEAKRIRRVILIGPSHRYYFQGCAIPAADHFETPLGKIKIDTQFVEKLKEIDDIEVSDQVHALEHSLEVQLPFLQSCLHDFTLLPLLTSNVHPAIVAKLIDSLWQGDDCLLVVSSDLSHFHSYSEAQRIDRQTCTMIDNYEPTIVPEQACGSTGINTLLLLAKRRGYTLIRKALINSGDTDAGDKERVVGYVSYLVSEPQ
ncbi:AmmeMemoRadiSam system protein B [Photobacterium sp. DNB23_23_1]|uniref:AmmeMemoRadiSam system protein B n=1 Tax=Photobacterium pectinilyticum TaxID=2906793 RepID=A0ABT1MZN9_9GAMM|nr:AmmeMemoRadiSam system protein B [Photobacterium sp. ZSDE20]MCQ1057961.1 AmmeMemoRadiSam system protein B [Photobacterium sp. ZSDE20]MDD1822493.1 AmmeMemoRadiSam system protein B [Photobacterium sp. ZSDE20]